METPSRRGRSAPLGEKRSEQSGLLDLSQATYMRPAHGVSDLLCRRLHPLFGQLLENLVLRSGEAGVGLLLKDEDSCPHFASGQGLDAPLGEQDLPPGIIVELVHLLVLTLGVGRLLERGENKFPLVAGAVAGEHAPGDAPLGSLPRRVENDIDQGLQSLPGQLRSLPYYLSQLEPDAHLEALGRQ